MEVVIKRTYATGGTNGEVLVNGKRRCYSIELPWVDNARRISCIPEGTYPLVKRTSKKYGRHILVNNVPGRDLILIHPANHAATELMGCIAPVTTLSGEGRGLRSRLAFEPLRDAVYGALDRGENVTLKITKK